VNQYTRPCPHIASSQKPVEGKGLCSNHYKKLLKCIDDYSACEYTCIHFTYACINGCTCTHQYIFKKSPPLSNTLAHTPFTHLFLPLPLPPTVIQKPTWRTVPSPHPSSGWSRSKTLSTVPPPIGIVCVGVYRGVCNVFSELITVYTCTLILGFPVMYINLNTHY